MQGAGHSKFVNQVGKPATVWELLQGHQQSRVGKHQGVVSQSANPEQLGMSGAIHKVEEVMNVLPPEAKLQLKGEIVEALQHDMSSPSNNFALSRS